MKAGGERRRSWSFESISIWLSPGSVTHPESHVSHSLFYTPNHEFRRLKICQIPKIQWHIPIKKLFSWQILVILVITMIMNKLKFIEMMMIMAVAFIQNGHLWDNKMFLDFKFYTFCTHWERMLQCGSVAVFNNVYLAQCILMYTSTVHSCIFCILVQCSA